MAARRALHTVDPESTSEPSGPDLASSQEPARSAMRLRVARASNGVEVGAISVPQDEPNVRPDSIRRTEDRLLGAIKAGDLANALTLASVLVYMDPSNAIARSIKDRCAKQMDLAPTRSFPRHDAIPRQRLAWSELTRRTLSREEAFLLWCVDGRSTVEEILDASAMPPLVAFETLDTLIREGLVDFS